MAPRNAGPAGSGLLPPGTGGTTSEDQDVEERVDDGDESENVEDVDLEGVPPVDDGEDDDEEGDNDDGGSNQNLDTIVQQLESKFQRKFDSAVSKAVRNLERKYADNDRGSGSNGGGNSNEGSGSGGGSGAGVNRRDRSDSQRSSVTSIRLLARDRISDEMEDSGKQERSAVKKVIDEVLPFVDWSLVDDEDEFVDSLVTRLKGVSSDLVKTGSDRKVAQLRKAGVLQQRPGQPGSASGSRGQGQVGKKLEKGSAIASQRFPGGQRSLHSR